MRTVEGFSFIELMIGLLISSILSLTLYQIFNQTQRSTKKIQSIMDYTILVPTIYNQLEADIAALFVPEQFLRNLEEKKPEAKKLEAQKVKPIKNVFYSQSKNKNLETLSFISTHSLSLYSSVLPRNVRVVYKLVPMQQEGVKELYRLTRQETIDLTVDVQQFKGDKIRAYDLLTNIKTLTVRFLVPEKLPKPTKDQEKKPEKQKPRVYKDFFTWQPEEMKNKSEYLVPAFIVIEGICIDPLIKQERRFGWRFGVAGFDGLEERLKQIKYPQETPKQKNEPESKPPSNTQSLKKPPLELKGEVEIVKKNPVETGA